MCGVTGFIDYKKKSSLAILKKQCDTLYHRGPDGEGQQLFQLATAFVGLGHRRLSIIDLSAGGKQPMQFQHLYITFNGEIYNYQEIKDELVVKGHTFLSHSDTEMILHAFAEWGIDCIQKFIGMFAFVILDVQKQELYCVRDRAGVKPFFYYWLDGIFLFGSELKALLAHPAFKKEINLDAVAAFMQYGYVPTPHCIWQNAHKLKPGHYLYFKIRTSTFNIKKYWDVYDAYNKPKLKIDFQEAKQETERILKSACDYRMVADVPVGVFLSGGYDSSCVTALLQKDRTEKIKTFTIGVGDKSLNEAPFAKKIAEHLGTEHTEYYCTEKDALELIPDLPFYYDEPFGDYSAIPTTLVSKMARKEVTVALSADAGDEVFAGYNRYDYPSQLGWIEKIPKSIRHLLSNGMRLIPLHNFVSLSKIHPLFSFRYQKFQLLLGNSSTQNLMKNMTTQFFDADLQKLLKTTLDPINTYFDDKLNANSGDSLASMMATDYQTYLLDDILQKVDRATMTVSLEGREPFLDHRIIDWAAQLPTNHKYNKGNKKYIVKEIVYQYIPKSIMERPKMGFAVPMITWLRNELKDYLEIYLNEAKIVQQAIFVPSEVSQIKKRFLHGQDEFGLKIWYLLMFQMWYEKWAL
jgi:asparagine synthase (glutamine-hydrolysing)